MPVKFGPFSPVLNLARTFLDFVYPPVCLICKEVIQEKNSPEFSSNLRPSVCSNCWVSLETCEKPYCPECKNELDNLQIDCCASHLKSVYALGIFDENFQELIHHFKYKGKISLGKSIGLRLAEELRKQDLSEIAYIIPVPLHKVRKRERGFNQSEILAEILGVELNLKVDKSVLSRIRNTKDQTKLSEEERKQNVTGAFKVQDELQILKDKKIILVDDVITTGATLKECAQVLKQAGAQKILGVTIAKAS